jgi:methionyl-tRNA formyltransferase
MLRYAFLVLEEHPYGRIMLQHLIDGDFVPGVIIEEKSNLSDVEREKFLARMDGQPQAPSTVELATRHQVEIKKVPNHNDPTCKEMLEEFQPVLTVLGGTRIIKDYILTIAPLGTVNCHPGLLPWLRGSASIGWALYKDMKIGATCHFIDPNIDTGAILLRKELPVYRHDTYESLNYRVAVLAAELMTEVVGRFYNDVKITGIPQDPNEGETFRVIPDDLLEIGKKRLLEGNYSHYSD